MNDFFSYLLEANAVLALLVLGFALLLQNIPRFQFNRLLLLGIVVVSLSAPFISISALFPNSPTVFTYAPALPSFSEAPKQGALNDSPTVMSPNNESEPLLSVEEEQSWSLTNALQVIYFIGVFVFTLMFVVQWLRIILITRNATLMKWNEEHVYVTGIPEANFSFFHNIYVGNTWHSFTEEEKKMVFLHEQEHVQQGHSYDILLLEILKILCWFNPAVWMLKSILRMYHEYQADAAVQRKHHPADYARTLLKFANQASIHIAGTHSISTFFNLKKRLNMMTKSQGKSPLWRYAAFILLLGFSCTLNEEYEAITYSDNLKYIESVYISHQSDTQDKNNRRVAIAYFNPDGTFQKAVQHMTYPYTEMETEELRFWTTPKLEKLPFIMDGFTIGQARNNLLYGNAWPKVYAEHIQGLYTIYNQKGLLDNQADINFSGNLPTKISAVKNFRVEVNSSSFIPNPTEINFYEYSENKVSYYKQAFDYHIEVIKTSNSEESKIIKSKKSNPIVRSEAYFSYDGENLIKVDEGRKKYKFYYEEDVLVKSEFYIAGNLMHHREYFYKEDGRRDKTLIYNTLNEPEYTIKYNYGYYEAE